MHMGIGRVTELILQDGRRAARISCPAELIPAPGQYALASDDSRAPLPVSLSVTDSAPGGFIALPIPDHWMPSLEISLRGPLGNGFKLPASARKIALVASEVLPSRLRGLIRPALSQGAAVVFVSDSLVENLSDEVEAQPLSALNEIMEWADYAAFDAPREAVPGLRERLGKLNQASAWKEAEVFIQTPVPCGGIAECGVCAVVTKSGWKMACKDGPVFALGEL
jgi:NAD(P)H-flavin reductase